MKNGKINILLMLDSTKSAHFNIERALLERDQEFAYEYIFAKKCSVILKDGKEILYYNGKPFDLSEFDAYFSPRSGNSYAKLQSLFRNYGLFCVQDADTMRISADKYETLHIVSKVGVPVPNTFFLKNEEQFSDYEAFANTLKETVGDFPLLIKPNAESLGRGVTLVNSVDEIKNYFYENRAIRKSNYLIEQYISPNNREDERHIVIDGKVCNSMKRISTTDSVATNLAAGGMAMAIKADDETRALCKKITDALGMKYAGIDIIRDEKGNPYFLEANAFPLEKIISVTHHNHFNDLLDFIKVNVLNK